ncbi:MAG: class I SAM-dependent methyltransferase [Zoogloeaceae bacterium]|nr:class I SAM-dependent methyltransferase [Zoogloeaceae bacterium]
MSDTAPRIAWRDAAGQEHSARWLSESGARAPARVLPADDTMPADTAYRLACEGTALLWTGDYHNARQLLQALGRRFDRSRAKRRAPTDPAEAFNLYRMSQAQRARTLGLLLVPVEPGWQVPLGRAPDVVAACSEAWGELAEPAVLSLRELQGAVGAHQWQLNGVEVPALGERIHARYGVFSPVRGEYVDLVAQAPLPAGVRTAFDLGTGTGVLAAVLARRGVAHVVATDNSPRALKCARDNLERLDLAGSVEVLEADLYPPGRAGLVVCNPPWLPARAGSSLDRAVYDPEGAMLKGFLAGLVAHLEPGGEGWLILSDLAERLGLRAPGELQAAFESSGLQVLGRLDVRPRHGRATDPDDPLHAARKDEVTTLWRLAPVMPL